MVRVVYTTLRHWTLAKTRRISRHVFWLLLLAVPFQLLTVSCSNEIEPSPDALGVKMAKAKNSISESDGEPVRNDGDAERRNSEGCDVSDALARLLVRDPEISHEAEAALKNEIWNQLRTLETLPHDFVDVAISVSEDQEQLDSVRDYALQHLGAVGERLTEPEQKAAVTKRLKEVAKTGSLPFAGTALIALARQTASQNADKIFVRKQAAMLAGDSETHPAARITAIQLCGELEVVDALPAIRAIALNSYEAVPLRMVAVNTLARLGGQEDRTALERLAKTNAIERLRPALDAAVGRRD